MARILQEREVQALQELARKIAERGLAAEGAQLQLILERTERDRDVDIPLAARVLHASPQVVDAWVKSGRLPGRVDEGGRSFVDLEALSLVVELDRAMPYADLAAPDVTEEEILAEIAAYRAEQNAR